MHVTREAVISSRIEGTRTQIAEALLPETEIAPERRNDWREVINYIKAMNWALQELERLPLCGRLLRHAHKILMEGVRGENKLPGEYRKSQNWIGGASLADAIFVPPSHELVPDLMSDLEHFLHNNRIHLPELIRIAIAHYQFETIHPFLDGNGRIGRLMITLYLINKKLIDKPLLYPSAFFEKNKNLYYDNLTRVRTHDDMHQWIKFFLVGLEQTATQAIEVFKQVLNFKSQTEDLIQNHLGRRAMRGLALLKILLHNPVITIDKAAQQLGITFKSASELIKLMVEERILTEITGFSRNRIFVMTQYLQAFEIQPQT